MSEVGAYLSVAAVLDACSDCRRTDQQCCPEAAPEKGEPVAYATFGKSLADKMSRSEGGRISRGISLSDLPKLAHARPIIS